MTDGEVKENEKKKEREKDREAGDEVGVSPVCSRVRLNFIYRIAHERTNRTWENSYIPVLCEPIRSTFASRTEKQGKRKREKER